MAKKTKITETTMTTRTLTVNFEGFSLTLNDQSRKIKDKKITIILTRDVTLSHQANRERPEIFFDDDEWIFTRS